MSSNLKWLEWAREIQALSQTGLTYSQNHYETARYERLMTIASEITAAHTGLDAQALCENFLSQPGYATPKVDVRGAMIREGKILLVQEKSDERWCMPGGWADVGDIPSEMVAREVVEESGLIVHPIRLIGVYDANRNGTPLSFFHAYKLVFLCEIVGGTPSGGDETLVAEFYDPGSLPALSIERTNHRHIADALSCWHDPALPAKFD